MLPLLAVRSRLAAAAAPRRTTAAPAELDVPRRRASTRPSRSTAGSTSRCGAAPRVLTGFSLYQPVDGRPAPDSTEVLVWYSPTAIHFGVRAFEPHGAVRATLADRDRVAADDNVEIHLDTFDERRRALVFIVNPLGVQADGTKSEGGGFIPGSNVVARAERPQRRLPLAVERARHRRGATRSSCASRSAACAIPSRTPQRWGIQVVRQRAAQRLRADVDAGAARRRRRSSRRRARSSGSAGCGTGRCVELNPEVTSTRRPARRRAAADAARWRYASDARLGGNVRWGIGSDLVLNGTVRPDFSQVEADAHADRRRPALRALLPRAAPVLRRGDRAVQRAEHARLHAAHRAARGGGEAHRQGRAHRRRRALRGRRPARRRPTARARSSTSCALRRDLGEQSTVGRAVQRPHERRRASNRVAGADARFVFGRLYYAQLQAVQQRDAPSGGATRVAPMWEARRRPHGAQLRLPLQAHRHRPALRDRQRLRAAHRVRAAERREPLHASTGGRARCSSATTCSRSRTRSGATTTSSPGASLLENRVSASNQLTFRGGWSVNVNPALARYAFDPASYAGLPRVGAGRTPSPSCRPTAIATLVLGVRRRDAAVPPLLGVGGHGVGERRGLRRDVARAAPRLSTPRGPAAERAAARDRDVPEQRRSRAAATASASLVDAHPARCAPSTRSRARSSCASCRSTSRRAARRCATRARAAAAPASSRDGAFAPSAPSASNGLRTRLALLVPADARHRVLRRLRQHARPSRTRSRSATCAARATASS